METSESATAEDSGNPVASRDIPTRKIDRHIRTMCRSSSICSNWTACLSLTSTYCLARLWSPSYRGYWRGTSVPAVTALDRIRREGISRVEPNVGQV